MACDPVVEPRVCGWGCHRRIEQWFIVGGSGIDEVRVRVVGGLTTTDHRRGRGGGGLTGVEWRRGGRGAASTACGRRWAVCWEEVEVVVESSQE
jgi:hypothetical protein